METQEMYTLEEVQDAVNFWAMVYVNRVYIADYLNKKRQERALNALEVIEPKQIR